MVNLEKAVAWLEEMKALAEQTIEESKKLPYAVNNIRHYKRIENCRTLLDALRQMRTEPCRCTEICGICNNPNYHIHSSIWWKSASTEYGRENREIPTRHCPNCGRLVKHDG